MSRAESRAVLINWKQTESSQQCCNLVFQTEEDKKEGDDCRKKEEFNKLKRV